MRARSRPDVPTTSRFRGVHAYLAGWYRALFPIPAQVVDQMTPSQIAGTLGLDRVAAGAGGQAVVAQPLDENAPLPGQDVSDEVREAASARRIRRVMEAG